MKDLLKLKKEYEVNGYIHLPSFFESNEILELDKAYDEAVQNDLIKPKDGSLFGGNDAIYFHPTFEKICKQTKLIEIIEFLLEQPIELQHSKLNVKAPRSTEGSEIKVHQDYPFFPHTNFDLISVGIHMDDESLESGPMYFANGSQKLGVLSHCTEQKFVYECTEKNKLGNLVFNPVVCSKGDITIHDSRTLHYSGLNNSDKYRRLLVFQYRAIDAIQIGGPIWKCTGKQVSNKSYSKGLARFMDGTKVELRGKDGRLFDLFGALKPNQE